MKNLILNTVQKEARKESEKNTLMDEYGMFWGIVGNIVGRWVLGILGAAFDALVVSGSLYLVSQNFWLSAVSGVVVAITVQLVSGSSLMKVTKAFKTGKWSNKAFRRQIFILSFLYVTMFSLSILFSLNTDKPVIAQGERTKDKKEINTTPIKREYEQKRHEVNKRYDQEKAASESKILALKTEVKELRAEKNKVLDNNGNYVTGWKERKEAANKEKKQIPAEEAYKKELEKKRQKEIDELKTEEKAEIAKIENKNQTTSQKIEAWAAMAGQGSKFINVGFQIVRCFILVGFMIFLVDSQEQTQTDNRSAKDKFLELAGRPSTPEVVPINMHSTTQPDDFTIRRLLADRENKQYEIDQLRDKKGTERVTETKASTGTEQITKEQFLQQFGHGTGKPRKTKKRHAKSTSAFPVTPKDGNGTETKGRKVVVKDKTVTKKNCLNCGKVIVAKTSRKKYCNDGCRKAYNRKVNK